VAFLFRKQSELTFQQGQIVRLASYCLLPACLRWMLSNSRTAVRSRKGIPEGSIWSKNALMPTRGCRGEITGLPAASHRTTH